MREEVLSDWTDACVPAWTVLQALLGSGWLPGEVPKQHTVKSVRIWGVLTDAVASKSYLRCLLALQELLGDADATLAVGQLKCYYDCVLARRSVVGVSAGLKAVEYKALQQSEHGPDDAGELAASSGMLEDCDVGVPCVVPPRRLALQDQKRVRGPPAGADEPAAKRRAVKPKKEVRPEDDWVSLLGLPAPSVEESAEQLALPAPPAQDVSAGSSGGVSEGGALVVLEPPAEPPALGAAVASARAGEERWVENHLILNPGSGVLGRPGCYRLYHVNCKEHAKCRAQRSISARFGGETGLGEEEPFAFLGVWLRDRGKFSTAAAHKAYRKEIKSADVQAYAPTLGL